MVAAFSYAIGPYDARPWWEGISGAFTVVGSACLLVDAVVGGRFRTETLRFRALRACPQTTL